MSHLVSVNTIRAPFDSDDSDCTGHWELRFDESHPEEVTLVVHVDDGGAPRRLVSRLDPDHVERLIAWLAAVRAESFGREQELVAPAPAWNAAVTTATRGLTVEQIDRAVTYNRARPYAADLWRAIQRHVGAGADGIPGAATARAVAVYQQRAGLDVDGKVGPGTLGNMNVGPIRTLDEQAFFFIGRMSINADGAGDAYNRGDTGIDFLANAGRPGNWWGVATNARGVPYVQDTHDPFPGYYVSTTALADASHPRQDPRRYVDSNTVPFIVMPGNIHDLVATPTVRKGDLAVVVRRSRPDRVVYAIYADVGPRKILDPATPFGEGSIALARALDHDPFVVRRGIRRAAVSLSDDILYVVFPGSGLGRPLDVDTLNTRAAAAFRAWGGQDRLEQALAMCTTPARNGAST